MIRYGHGGRCTPCRRPALESDASVPIELKDGVYDHLRQAAVAVG